MDPEFKAFIDAIAPECSKARKPSFLGRVKNAPRNIYTVFADAINDIGAFRCDFRPFQRLREVCKKCEIKQAIGYHGLL
jgi:hypothetical protein